MVKMDIHVGPVRAVPMIIRNVADVTLSINTGAQSPFEAANDTFNVIGGVTYEMIGQFKLAALAATAHNTALSFGGTATVASILYVNSVFPGAEDATGTSQHTRSIAVTAATNAFNTTHSTASEVYQLRGLVNFSAAGTFIPQIEWSTSLVSGTPVSRANGYFMLRPLMANGIGGVGAVT